MRVVEAHVNEASLATGLVAPHCQVVADKSVGAAGGSIDVGQCDLCGGR